jgi:hypothetical protein
MNKWRSLISLQLNRHRNEPQYPSDREEPERSQHLQ